MYKVNNTLTSAYGNPMDMQDLKPKQGPVSVLIYLIFKFPWDQFLGPMGPFISLKKTEQCIWKSYGHTGPQTQARTSKCFDLSHN